MKQLLIFAVLILIPAVSFSATPARNVSSRLLLEAENYFAKEQYNDAIEVYQKILKYDPDNRQAISGVGMVLTSFGQYDKALIFSQKAVSLKPDDAESYFRLGVVFGYIGDFDKALESFQRALALEPNFPEAYFNEGLMYWHKGKYDEAIGAYRKFLDVHPGAQSAKYLRGVFEIIRPNYLQEIIKCQEIILRGKPEAKTYGSLGVVYGQTGRYEQSIANLDKAVNLSGDYAKGFYNLGVSLQRSGQEGIQAKNYFAKAAGLKAKYALILNNNNLSNNLPQFDNEIGCIQQSASPLFYVGFADAYYNLGRVYCLKKDGAHLKEQIVELEKLSRYDLIDDLTQCVEQTK